MRRKAEMLAVGRYLGSGAKPVLMPEWIANLRPLVERQLAIAGLDADVDAIMAFLTKLQPSSFEEDSPLDEGRYVAMHSRKLKQLLGMDYKKVLQALARQDNRQSDSSALFGDSVMEDSQIISVYGGELQEEEGTKRGARSGEGLFVPGERSKAYRIIPRHWPENPLDELAQLPHRKEVAFKIWCEQDDELRDILVKSARRQLTQMTMRICSSMDLAQCEKDVRAYSEAKKQLGNNEPIKSFRFVNMLVNQQYFYEESCDEFGHRYHSPLTNTPRHLREYIRFDGKPGVEVDFKNCQYYLLALCAKYPDAVISLLDDTDDKPATIRLILRLRKMYKETEDGYMFCEQALAGTLYEWLMQATGKTRKEVKSDLMPVVMSDSSEAKKLKQQYQNVIPSVIQTCGELNAPTAENLAAWEKVKAERGRFYSKDQLLKFKSKFYLKSNSVPMLMQRMEAKIILDRIAVELHAASNKAFTTLHDAYLTHPDIVGLLLSLVTQWFLSLGIPEADHPKVKTEARTGYNDPSRT